MVGKCPIRLGFVFALMDEARPFIREWPMKPAHPLPGFSFFQGEDVAAVVTGMGSERAAAGTTALLSWVYTRNRDLAPHRFFGRTSRLPDFSLINIGLAGRIDRDPETLGQTFLIHRLRHQATGETFYPDLLHRWEGMPEASLTTVAKPVFGDSPKKELDADLVDMEGTGIAMGARAFLQNHQVHFYKIASDLLSPMKNLRQTTGPWLQETARKLVPGLKQWLSQSPESPPLTEAQFVWMRSVAKKLRFSFTRTRSWEQLCLSTALQGKPLPLDYHPPANLSKKDQHEQWHHLQKLLDVTKP
ncbi:MAG: hypothetical protein LAT55_11665 [Opitutales bacterium]|nr:hypothetical protein [Opitutales bacterium]